MGKMCLRAPAGAVRAALGLGPDVPASVARELAERAAAAAIANPAIAMALPGQGRKLIAVLRPSALRALRASARQAGCDSLERACVAEQVSRLERAADRATEGTVNLADTGAPTRRAARRWRTADGGEPHAWASPVPPGPAPRPVAVGRVPTTARA